MSTFGEIVEPGSRNSWEDWDDVLTNQLNDIKWQNKDVPPPTKLKTLLFLEGKYLANKIKNQTELKLDLINCIPEVNLKLYKTESADYICVLQNYNLLYSSEVVELLKEYILKSEDVVAIMTKALVEYQVQEVVSEPYVMRSLCTTKPLSKSLNIHIPKLEQPNMISGVSAGVICLRENMGLPGVAIVCYTENPEDYRVDELQQLLENMKVITLNPKPNNSSIFNSNLYI